MRAAVFASGSGSNLQALVDRQARGAAYSVELVVTDRPCGAEARAGARRIACERIPFGGDSGATGDRILDLLGRRRIDAILLAGFLRLIPPAVCRVFRNRILNIHPALLPSFGGRGMHGRRVHEAVLRTGATLSGPTIHFVNERYDEGRILAQWPLPVRPGDSPETLAARVLRVEHLLFPVAADALARALERGWPKRGRGPSFRWPGSEGTDDDRALKRAVEEAFGDDGHLDDRNWPNMRWSVT